MKINPERLKVKIISTDRDRWWGDDFDVRFYMLDNIVNLKKKTILDLGGGIGIISHEIDEDNVVVNLDISHADVKRCINKKPKINGVCGSMTHLPFSEELFDVVICSHLVEVAKINDLGEKNESRNGLRYPTVDALLGEIQRCLKKSGRLFLTTCNNEYYKSDKLTYKEMKESLEKYFPGVKIKFFNTYPRLSQTNIKLNLAYMIPKLKNQFQNRHKVINSLLKEKSRNDYSVSFYVDTKKT